MKCSKCHQPFPKEEQAYIKGKIVCQKCYDKLKTGKGGNGNGSMQKAYLNFLNTPCHKGKGN